ncbi:hypothetical protein H0A71_21455 [Alcaligenaceae bacterium]|nr:hypothetical protein [Alcaligenaceae bacterium]
MFRILRFTSILAIVILAGCADLLGSYPYSYSRQPQQQSAAAELARLRGNIMRGPSPPTIGFQVSEHQNPPIKTNKDKHPISVSPSATQLPLDAIYDFKAFKKLVPRSLRNFEKDEFETKDEFLARRAAAGSVMGFNPEALYALKLRATPLYNAEKGGYSVHSICKGFPTFDQIYCEMADRLTLSSKKYSASNSYGAGTTVRSDSREMMEAAVKSPSAITTWAYRISDTSDSFDIFLRQDASEARALKDKTINIALISQISEPVPFVAGEDYTEATYLKPYESFTKIYRIGIYAKQLWLYDAKSGRVLKKYGLER